MRPALEVVYPHPWVLPSEIVGDRITVDDVIVAGQEEEPPLPQRLLTVHVLEEPRAIVDDVLVPQLTENDERCRLPQFTGGETSSNSCVGKWLEELRPEKRSVRKDVGAIEVGDTVENVRLIELDVRQHEAAKRVAERVNLWQRELLAHETAHRVRNLGRGWEGGNRPASNSSRQARQARGFEDYERAVVGA
eukprot:4047924-Prymnesium_polylepis.2